MPIGSPMALLFLLETCRKDGLLSCVRLEGHTVSYHVLVGCSRVGRRSVWPRGVRGMPLQPLDIIATGTLSPAGGPRW